MAKKQSLTQIETSLSRWKTRLRRAVTMIDKLEKQQKRLIKATAVRVSVPAHPTVDSETTLGAVPPPVEVCDPPGTTQLKPVPAIVEVDTSIPSFLRRQKPGSPIGDQIKAEIEERKKAKARGRIATMKAKQSGEMKKMPLTGRAALEAIRQSK